MRPASHNAGGAIRRSLPPPVLIDALEPRIIELSTIVLVAISVRNNIAVHSNSYAYPCCLLNSFTICRAADTICTAPGESE